MLVILAMIGVAFFAYALAFDKISDAIPSSLKGAKAEKPTDDPT